MSADRAADSGVSELQDYHVWLQKMDELSTKVTDTSAQQQDEGREDTAGKSAGKEDKEPEVDDDTCWEILQALGHDSSSEDEPNSRGDMLTDHNFQELIADINLDPTTSNFRNDISPENYRNVALAELQNGYPLSEDSRVCLVTHGKLEYSESKVSKKGKPYVYFKLSSPQCQRPVTFLIFGLKMMRTIQEAKIGSTITLCGFHEMPRDTRYDLAYSIWNRNVYAKITVLQKTQQPAATGDGAKSANRGGVLTLFGRAADAGGPPGVGRCGGSGQRGGGSSEGGGGATSHPQRQHQPQQLQELQQLPQNEERPHVEQQLTGPQKRGRGRPTGARNLTSTEKPPPPGSVPWHPIVLKVQDNKRTQANARQLAADIKRNAKDLGLPLKGHELPTVNKILSLWNLTQSPDTRNDDIVCKRPRRGRPHFHFRDCACPDAQLEGLSGGEEDCEAPAAREELQYANHLSNKFFQGTSCVYPVYMDTVNVVFCIPSMSCSPDGRLRYGETPVFIHIGKFDDGTCAVQCSACDKPAGFWPNNFYRGIYSVKKSSGFQSSDTSVDTTPILKPLCKCAWALFAFPSRRAAREPTPNLHLWEQQEKICAGHTQWPDLDITKLGSSVNTTDTIFRQHHDGWLIQVGEFGTEGCGFVKMYRRGPQEKYVVDCQTCGGKARCRHEHALSNLVTMYTSDGATMKMSRVHTEQSYKKVMDRYAETPDTLKLLVKSKRLIPDVPEEEVETYLRLTPVDQQVYFKLSFKNNYSAHQLEYMGFRSPGDLGSFGSGRAALWAPHGALKDLPIEGTPCPPPLQSVTSTTVASLFHIGGVVAVNIETPFDGNDCAVINVDDQYMFSWELIRQFLLELRLKATNYSSFVRSRYPTWLRCMKQCPELQKLFPSWINPKSADMDVIKSLKVRFSRAIHGYLTLLDRDWDKVFECRCVFANNTVGSIVYDNACNAVCFIMNREASFLKTFSVRCDDFHHSHGSTGRGHVNCGPGTAMANAGTHTQKEYFGNMIEQKNSKVKPLKALVYCSNQVWMMSIFRYYHAAENVLQMAVLQYQKWQRGKTNELTQIRPHALFGVDATFLPQGGQHAFIQRTWEHPEAECETRWGNPVASRDRQMIGLLEHRDTLKTMLQVNKKTGDFQEFKWTEEHKNFLTFLQTHRKPILWLIRLECKNKAGNAVNNPHWKRQQPNMLFEIHPMTSVRFCKECQIVRKVFQNWAARNPEVQFIFPNEADAVNKVLTTHECTVDALRAARDSSGQHIRDILDFDNYVNLNAESLLSSDCRALLTLILEVVNSSLQTSCETIAAANSRPLPQIEEHKNSESWLLTAEWFPNNPVRRTPTGTFLPARRYIADEKKDGSPKTLREVAASSVCHKRLYAGKNSKHGLMTVHCMYCCQNVGFSFLDKPESVRTLFNLFHHRKMLRGEIHAEPSLEQSDSEVPIDADADVGVQTDSDADSETTELEDMSNDESSQSSS